jgi:hypothetical protein
MTTVFDTGLDWSSDRFTEAEWQRMAQWYVDTHGIESLDLVKFIPFMLHLRPDALKHYRRWVEVTPAGVGLENPIPAPALGLVWLHFYCVNCYPQGILYEVIAAREWGARRSEVADTITVAWLQGGPFGANTAAGVAADYMDEWGKQPEGRGTTWPDGWSPDPDAFRSGISLDTENTMSADDLGRLEEWHSRVQGAVPAYVPFLARNYPLALKTWRGRYENAMAGTLPKQIIAIFQIHVASMLKRPDAVRRSVTMARTFGVKKDHVTMALANTQVYLGDLAMDAAVEGVADLLDGWED